MRSLTIIFLVALLSLMGCKPAPRADDEIYVGTISGPETQLMEVAQAVALKKYQLKIKIIEFSDYLLPNRALNDGNLDANMFQHQLYLEEEIKQKHYQLIGIGKTFIYPMGIYSKKIKKIDALPDPAVVAIPNDPTNEGRALLLLKKAGLIQLAKNKSSLITPQDIVYKSKNIDIKELDAAQLTRVLPDVDLAVINTNYAVLANLYPSRDALLLEGKDSPYANIVVAQTSHKNDSKLKILVDALHSPEVSAEAKKVFKGEAIPAW